MFKLQINSSRDVEYTLYGSPTGIVRWRAEIIKYDKKGNGEKTKIVEGKSRELLMDKGTNSYLSSLESLHTSRYLGDLST